jgi:hypothetical protein
MSQASGLIRTPLFWLLHFISTMVLRLTLKVVIRSALAICLLIAVDNSSGRAQHKSQPKSPTTTKQIRSLELLGIRPGISIDSVRKALGTGVQLREVGEDSLTHSIGDKALHIYLVDSIFCRLTYMRMIFVFDDASRHLRRFAITPRASAIILAQNDDIDAALLLYFGEGWGKPELLFDPPACFKWRTGNIEMRGFIKRG